MLEPVYHKMFMVNNGNLASGNIVPILLISHDLLTWSYFSFHFSTRTRTFSINKHLYILNLRTFYIVLTPSHSCHVRGEDS